MRPTGMDLRKQLREQVDGALAALAKEHVSDDDVHLARRSLKKARALLRLLRPSLGNARYRSLNATLRDAASPLSQVRDARVLLETLHALEQQHRKRTHSVGLAAFKRALTDQRTTLDRQVRADNTGAIAHSRRTLRDSLRFIDRLPRARSEQEREVLGEGLERVYLKGCRAMADARKRQEPAAFHEWRKQVKYLRYELEPLQPLSPRKIGKRATQAHKLSDYLGDEHDLTVLAEAAAAKRDLFRDEAALQDLLTLIAKRQSKLRDKALPLGAQLFDEKPKEFVRRLDKQWNQ